MKDRADRYVLAGQRGARAALGEAADSDDDARLQQPHDVAQRLVARAEERLLLRCAAACRACDCAPLDSMNASGQ